MLLSLQPDADRDETLKNLRQVQAAATDLSGFDVSGAAYPVLMAYLEWASNAVHALQSQVGSSDLDRLIFTRGYDRLLSAAGSMQSTYHHFQGVLKDLVSLELQQRIGALDKQIKDLAARIRDWPRDETYVVADTSFYVEYERKLEEVDFSCLLPGWTDKRIHLLAPVIILDELEGVKRKGQQLPNWRAAYTLSFIDKIFAKDKRIPGVIPALAEAPRRTRGVVRMEILCDPPGHVRLPINDDELINRTLAAQALAGTTVTLLTFDTNQDARAREAGLATIKLTVPIGPEPAPRAAKHKHSHGAGGLPDD